jgi:polar amino acid transport system substrate-binding protein
VLLGACGGGGDAKATGVTAIGETLPAQIRKARVITVGSDIEYPPLEFFGEGASTPQGFDVDLADAIAERLGVSARFVNFTDLDGLVPALVAGRFDVVMSGLTDTPERRALGAVFVDYLMTGTSMLVPKGNPKGVKSLDDLCGQAVAVQKDTEQDIHAVPDQSAACRVVGRPELNVVALASEAAALDQLRRGRVAAVLTDAAVAGYSAMTAAGGTEFEEAGAPAGGGAYGIAVAAKATQLRDALAKSLGAVMADGTYRTLLEKWGLTRAALDAPTVIGRPAAPSGGRAPVRPRCCA